MNANTIQIVIRIDTTNEDGTTTTTEHVLASDQLVIDHLTGLLAEHETWLNHALVTYDDPEDQSFYTEQAQSLIPLYRAIAPFSRVPNVIDNDIVND